MPGHFRSSVLPEGVGEQLMLALMNLEGRDLILGLALLAVCALALFVVASIVAKEARLHAKLAPLQAQRNFLMTILTTLTSQREQESVLQDISELGRKISVIKPAEQARWQEKGAFSCQPVLLFGVLASTIWCAETWLQAVVLALMMCLLWHVVQTDISSFDVMDKDVLVIGALGAMATILSHYSAWTRPEGALLGFLLVVSSIALAQAYFYLSSKLCSLFGRTRAHEESIQTETTRTELEAALGPVERDRPMFFGSGDTLLLIALSAYFGADVLVILFVAAVLFVLYSLVESISGKRSAVVEGALGEVSLGKRSALPFVPFIFAGTWVLLLLPSGMVDANRIAISILWHFNGGWGAGN